MNASKIVRIAPAAFGCLAGLGLLFGTNAARGQQATVAAPTHTLNHSFFEGIGTSWGIRGNGFFLQFGGPQIPLPPMGRPDPGAGLTGGLAWIGPSATAHLNFHALQGSRSSMISQTPSVTLPNGGAAYIGDASMSPFVIGVIPVVGGFAPMGFFGPAPLPSLPVDPWASVATAADVERWAARQRVAAEFARRQGDDSFEPPTAIVNAAEATAALPPVLNRRANKLQKPSSTEPAPAVQAPSAPAAARVAVEPGLVSSAELAVPGVAQAARLRAEEQRIVQQELLALFQRGEQARQEGNAGAARVYYRMVAQRGEGELKEAAQQRLAELQSATR